MILMLSILFLLSISTTCKSKIIHVPTTEAKVVGEVRDCHITWNDGEDPSQTYVIMTKAAPVMLAYYMHKSQILELELEKCREALTKKDEKQ